MHVHCVRPKHWSEEKFGNSVIISLGGHMGSLHKPPCVFPFRTIRGDRSSGAGELTKDISYNLALHIDGSISYDSFQHSREL